METLQTRHGLYTTLGSLLHTFRRVFFWVFFFALSTTPTLTGFDPATHLSFEDLAVDSQTQPSLIQLTLKESKTDPFRKRVQVVIGSTGDDLCLVAAVTAYLVTRGDIPGSLFYFSDGRPLTRSVFLSRVKAALQLPGLPARRYAGHRFWAGAATMAAAAGIEDSLIKTMGRWESSAYLLYISVFLRPSCRA